MSEKKVDDLLAKIASEALWGDLEKSFELIKEAEKVNEKDPRVIAMKTVVEQRLVYQKEIEQLANPSLYPMKNDGDTFKLNDDDGSCG